MVAALEIIGASLWGSTIAAVILSQYLAKNVKAKQDRLAMMTGEEREREAYLDWADMNSVP